MIEAVKASYTITSLAQITLKQMLANQCTKINRKHIQQVPHTQSMHVSSKISASITRQFRKNLQEFCPEKSKLVQTKLVQTFPQQFQHTNTSQNLSNMHLDQNFQQPMGVSITRNTRQLLTNLFKKASSNVLSILAQVESPIIHVFKHPQFHFSRPLKSQS